MYENIPKIALLNIHLNNFLQLISPEKQFIKSFSRCNLLNDDSELC